jgi:hypothetical protein
VVILKKTWHVVSNLYRKFDCSSIAARIKQARLSSCSYNFVGFHRLPGKSPWHCLFHTSMGYWDWKLHVATTAGPDNGGGKDRTADCAGVDDHIPSRSRRSWGPPLLARWKLLASARGTRRQVVAERRQPWRRP